jgi:hypothetical protein
MKHSETAKRILSVIFIASIMLSILVMPINGSMVEIPELKLKEATIISAFDESYFDTVVRDLQARDIIFGYPDGTIREYNLVTRAEMAAICTRLLEIGNKLDYVDVSYVPTVKYPDVSNDHWALMSIAFTNDCGVTQGYPDGTFRPENDVTLNEALKMILVSGGYRFGSSGSVPSYPNGYIQLGKELGVTDGIAYDGSRAALRGEIMVMTYQMLQIGQTPQGGDDKYVVRFDLNYDSPKGSIPDQSVNKGSYASRPTTENVKRSNYLLTGWYTDKDCKKEFSFDTKINSDITLFAKWVSWNDTLNSGEDYYEDMVRISNLLTGIEQKYYDSEGNVDFRNFRWVMAEVEICVNYLYEQDKILKIESIGSEGILIRLKDNSLFGFAPTNDKLLGGGGGGDVQISTYSPSTDISKYNAIPEIVKSYTMRSDTVAVNYINSGVNLETLEKMSGDIILWSGHGRYFEGDVGSVLQTGVEVTTETNNKYKLYRELGWILALTHKDGKLYYYITSGFINHCLTSNSVNNALVYLNACSSLKGPNYDLAKVFIDNGASVVIGNSDTTNAEYARHLMRDIMDKLTKINNDTGDYYTVEEAINFAHSNNYQEYKNLVKDYQKGDETAGIGTATWYRNKKFRLSDLYNVGIGLPNGVILTTGITGTVLDNGTKKPFISGNFVVKLTKVVSQEVYNIYPNSNGKFTMECLPGTYQFEICDNLGYVYHTSGYITVKENQVFDVGTIYLIERLIIVIPDKTTGIEGKTHYYMMDNANNVYPLAGVMVTLSKEGSSNQVYTAITDYNGNYKIECPEGNYRIDFYKEGYSLQKELIPHFPSVTIEKDKILNYWELNFKKLTKLTEGTIFVLDADTGVLIEDVKVYMREITATAGIVMFTDSMGAIFDFPSGLAGKYKIEFSKNGYKPCSIEVEVKNGVLGDVIIYLAKTGSSKNSGTRTEESAIGTGTTGNEIDLVTAYNTGIKVKLFANGSSISGAYVSHTDLRGRNKDNIRYGLTYVSDYRGDSGTFYVSMDYDGIIIYCPEGTYISVEVTISVGGQDYTSSCKDVVVKTKEMSQISMYF